MTRNTARALLCAVALAMASSAAFAAPLNLPTGLYPDIAATSNVTTAYNKGTLIFTVDGGISQYTEAGGAPSWVAGGGSGLTLTANIDNAGGLVSGTLVLNGVVPQIGIVVPTDLLTANLTAFGFSGSGQTSLFEFLGTVTGGQLSPEFGPQIGMVLNPGTTDFAGLFTTPFTGSAGTADVFAIPEPATMSILGLGLVAVLKRRR